MPVLIGEIGDFTPTMELPSIIGNRMLFEGVPIKMKSAFKKVRLIREPHRAAHSLWDRL
jgi:hypothetical protein